MTRIYRIGSTLSVEEMVSYREREKSRLLRQLWNLSGSGRTVGTAIDQFISDMEKKPEKKMRVSITKADLLRWAKILSKEGKHQHALKIFQWMEERKKMSFTPSQLALYVDLLVKIKGYDAANDYLYKVDPNFNHLDRNAKNWPAYQKLIDAINRSYDYNPMGITHAVKLKARRN